MSYTISIDPLGNIKTGLEARPIYERENGEEILLNRQKELETFLKCLETYPLNSVILRERTHFAFTGNEEEDIVWFRNRETKNDLLDFLLNPLNHKVDGKKWNNGFLGSRWADTTINGKFCRISFYSRKNDCDMFDNILEEKHYMLLVDLF